MGTNRLEGDREGEMVALVRMRVPEQKDMDGVCDVSSAVRVVDYKSLRECLEVVELPILLHWTRRGHRPKGNAGIFRFMACALASLWFQNSFYSVFDSIQSDGLSRFTSKRMWRRGHGVNVSERELDTVELRLRSPRPRLRCCRERQRDRATERRFTVGKLGDS